MLHGQPLRSGVSPAVAFSAAEAASAATAAVLGKTSPMEHVAKLTSSQSTSSERIAAVHRLNERFAACATYDDAVELAGQLCEPALFVSLMNLLADGECLVELVVQLMHSLSLHREGASALCRSGALPVVSAALRAEDPLLRTNGLILLATLAERQDLAGPLARAGVVKLLCFLGKSADVVHWPYLLEIAEGILRQPLVVPERQRQQLRDIFVDAAHWQKAGSLPLPPNDSRRLVRLLILMRGLNLAERSTSSARTRR